MTYQVPTQTMTLGQRVKAARTAAGLTQHELAVAVGSQSFEVSRWENGRHRPTDEKLEALADALGIERAALEHAGHSGEDAA